MIAGQGAGRRLALGMVGLVAGLLAATAGDELNGFDVARSRVERDQIIAGGPPRDGIPSVDQPEFVSVDQASWARPDTTVLGVALGDDARAYPGHLIERHQVVNDVLGGRPVAVTYDPLAGSPLAFDRRVDGRTLEFGVSGLLYNANFLLYDRQTESLWSQLEGRAVSGPLAGKTLTRIPVRQEDLASWISRHPDTKVLARPEPLRIDYRYSPYESYWVSDGIPFPVAARDRRFHAKELVLGVTAGGESRAYLGSILTRAGGVAEDEFQGHKIRLEYSTELGVFRYEIPDGVEVTEAYWFAWKAFHPETGIWRDPGETTGRTP